MKHIKRHLVYPACTTKDCPIIDSCDRNVKHGPNPKYIGALTEFEFDHDNNRCPMYRARPYTTEKNHG